MIGLLNLGSLIWGLIALMLPIISLMRIKKDNNKNYIALSAISISSCAMSLTLQNFAVSHLQKIEDRTALMDTTDALAILSITLISVIIILNIINLFLHRRRTSRQ